MFYAISVEHIAIAQTNLKSFRKVHFIIGPSDEWTNVTTLNIVIGDFLFDVVRIYPNKPF